MRSTFVIFFLFSAFLSTQNFEVIKTSNQYIWGEGIDKDKNIAEDHAIANLISQISINVESIFKDLVVEHNGNIQEYTESMVNTYSNVCLNNVPQISETIGNRYKVLRYIQKNRLNEIFLNRKLMILEYLKSGIEAEQKLKIADALKYYYWSFVLLHSHPDYNKITFNFSDMGERIAFIALQDRIQNILSSLNISIYSITQNNNTGKKVVKFEVRYKDYLVQTLDYKYWIGDGYSNLNSIKNGIGIVEFYGSEIDLKNFKLNIEYKYFNKSKLNPELGLVRQNLLNIPYFSEATQIIPIKKRIRKDKAITPKNIKIKGSKFNHADYIVESTEEVIFKIISALEIKNFKPVKKYFTSEGYGMLVRLFDYGSASLIDRNIDLQIIKLGNCLLVRSIKMKFDFPKNDRQFIEDVNFVFNMNNKIESITFSLSDISIHDILSKSENFASLEEKYQIINFMESYKTAYCLERLDYIESIFSENALIIVGSVIQVDRSIGEMYDQLGNSVEYYQLTKHEYIERLKKVFRNNEFINIDFESNNVKTINGNARVYGIQIKQNYYSTTYADKGYLFLIFDISNINQPKIYVRTWQPEKYPMPEINSIEMFEGLDTIILQEY